MRDDAKLVALLLLPFIAVAFAIAASHEGRRSKVPPVATQRPPLALKMIANGSIPTQIYRPYEPNLPFSSPSPLPSSRPAAVGAPASIPTPPAENHGNYCDSRPVSTPAAMLAAQLSPTEFGLALAAAARAQTGEFVVYNDAYQTISYPMGDVPAIYGVCTDVVIRAYRTLGIDLQKLVHEAGVGLRDRSIDHRRTGTLKRFLERFGESIPVTETAGDYVAGDIVTYFRPNNRGTRAHIAIVSDEKGISGAPMIVHNRGNGPELEDALFMDPITGHFRFRGMPSPVAEKAVAARTRR